METLSSKRSSETRLLRVPLERELLGGDVSIFRRDDRRSSPLPFNFGVLAYESSSLSESSGSGTKEKRKEKKNNSFESRCDLERYELILNGIYLEFGVVYF